MTDFTATENRVSTAGFDLGAAGITPPSNPDRRGVFLADVVVELGLADQETIDRAQRTAQETERSLEGYLLESGILDEGSLSRAIAERNGLDHVDLEEFEVDMEAAQMVARSAAERYRAVPVAFASDGALIVAVQDPFDTLGTSDIEVMTRSSVRPAIATGTGIDALVERLPEQPVSRPGEEVPAMEEAEEVSVDPVQSENGDAEGGPEVHVEEDPPADLVPPFRLDPAAEDGGAAEPDPELEPEVDPELEPEVDPELGLVRFPEPESKFEVVEADPEPEVVIDLKPELVRFPEDRAGATAELADELGSLQETARRADELAATVERRIGELKSGADERAAGLEADLAAAHRRVDELEAQTSGIDTLAEELRATTAKLEEVNRVLEGSVR
jgi:hypothetical protein